jgi:hypothetical protein
MTKEMFADEDDWFGTSTASGGVDFLSGASAAACAHRVFPAAPLRAPVSLAQLMHDMNEREVDALFPTHAPDAPAAAIVQRPAHQRRVRCGIALSTARALQAGEAIRSSVGGGG